MTSVRPMGTRHAGINHKSYLPMPTTVDVREPGSDPVPQEARYARVSRRRIGGGSASYILTRSLLGS